MVTGRQGVIHSLRLRADCDYELHYAGGIRALLIIDRSAYLDFHNQ
jgi:hypothetical protein